MHSLFDCDILYSIKKKFACVGRLNVQCIGFICSLIHEAAYRQTVVVGKKNQKFNSK